MTEKKIHPKNSLTISIRHKFSLWPPFNDLYLLQFSNYFIHFFWFNFCTGEHFFNQSLLGKLEAQDADVLTLFPLPPPSITADNIISAPTPPLDISTANHLDLFFLKQSI